MPEVPQTRTELEGHLREQVAFLRASARAYDGGFTGEAKRLAVVVPVLVHDTSTSTSLLSQLNLKGIEFFDTAYDYDPRKCFHSFHGLAMMKTGASSHMFVPRCAVPPKPFDEPLKLVSFDQWWKKVVVVDAKLNQFTRQQLVLTLSNCEGGAHVGPTLDDAYTALTRGYSMAMHYRFKDQEGPFGGIELASVRQIAHEVLLSLKKSCLEYIKYSPKRD